ncbi:hypothetical protein CEXT_782991 [Caerostris extrusa]|uniref:Uncharacterized protein n=1 Tax=Caerostris extrusa TaxID=172846 RepID=A0AAV4R689_CAEEX|nr:hypothetical protein CEXT_782991 [Caerostris extrusa]
METKGRQKRKKEKNIYKTTKGGRPRHATDAWGTLAGGRGLTQEKVVLIEWNKWHAASREGPDPWLGPNRLPLRVWRDESSPYLIVPENNPGTGSRSRPSKMIAGFRMSTFSTKSGVLHAASLPPSPLTSTCKLAGKSFCIMD